MTPSGFSHTDSPDASDPYCNKIDGPSDVAPGRRYGGQSLEFVDLFRDVGLSRPLNRSRLLSLFYAVPEIRVLSSSDVKLIKLGSKQQRLYYSRRCTHPINSQGDPPIYCPSALVEFALPGIARLILDHADCFRIMGVDVLPYSIVNQEKIKGHEGYGSRADALMEDSPNRRGLAPWRNKKSSVTEGSRVREPVTITTFKNSRQIWIPSHDVMDKGPNCDNWSWVAAVLAGDAGASPRARTD
ncbi:hypothetical protein NDU88_005840 [Pleurodeles waltl]|uniref:Uncharacterized protein n=1 Tax=Pleurodeles waltl TaxID=8319 RepID=A0AAV7MZ73_PLEWA|nr:hypothetical protein NDU88_005840 [Pleurodeles waltl]